MNTSGLTAGAVATPPPLREEVDEALERLSQRLSQQLVKEGLDSMQIAHGEDGSVPDAGAATEDIARLQTVVRFLGQVVSGWQNVPDEAFSGEGAGFGSTVEVEDVDRGVRETYTLMTGALLDIDAGQVSLASPIGRALLGTSPGAEVIVETPQRRRRLRVVSVCTLRDRLRKDA